MPPKAGTKWKGFLHFLDHWVLPIAAIILLVAFAYFVAVSVGRAVEITKCPDNEDCRTNEAGLVLSFIEGVSVIIGLGIALATAYGIRKIANTQEEFETLRAKVEAVTKNQDSWEETVRRSYAQNQRSYEESLVAVKTDTAQQVAKLVQIIQLMQQATYEMLLRNYGQVYYFVNKVLELDANNRYALYLAGWVEIHYINDELDNAIKHLEELVKLDPEWHSARAGLGVALRRKAKDLQRQKDSNLTARINTYYDQAERHLRRALVADDRLTDPNQESYWGPLGGLYRDTKRFDKAIDAYEQGYGITPKSSYPVGNLATLYLWKAQQQGETHGWENGALNQARQAFEKTLAFANAELLRSPGDYFNLMDIAMAETALAKDTAAESLRTVLQLDNPTNLLRVSLDGWKFLSEHYPNQSDRDQKVHQQIQTAIDELNARIGNVDESPT